MLSPQRDQTATRDALRELDVFLKTYPNSQYLPDVIKLHREARDRLSESEFLVGRHYYRTRWYPGAITRLEALLEADPGYTGRDGVYFYLGESLLKVNRPAEALPYFERIVKEFEKSEYLEEAQKRIASLSARADLKPT